MGTILFCTWDGGGNTPPLLGIATELQDRGHRVRVLGNRVQSARFAAAGLEFAGYPSAADFRSSVDARLRPLLANLCDRAKGRDVLAELAAHPADLVVVDTYLLGVMDTLRRAGRSYVVLEHSLDSSLRRDLSGPLGLLVRLLGFPARDLVDAGSPTLVPTLPELDPTSADVVHTGPVVRGRPAQPTEPTVLVSLSTVRFAGLADTWKRVLAAVDGLPARVIATAGPALDARNLRVPANVEMHPWLPHDEVLPHVSLVVGHGGHATTMAALAHDLPLLVLPIDRKTDQPRIGRTIEAVGAGRTLSRRSSPRRIREAIDVLLADGPHRDVAARLGAKIRELDGARRAADLLEGLVRDGAGSVGS